MSKAKGNRQIQAVFLLPLVLWYFRQPEKHSSKKTCFYWLYWLFLCRLLFYMDLLGLSTGYFVVILWLFTGYIFIINKL